MIKWFAANNLVLNLHKTNIIKFITKNSAHSTLCIGCKEKYLDETMNTKFLGLQTDNHINWEIDIVQIISKLNGAMLCY
jgi:rRNA maturation endonuclease Nob1